MDLKEYTTKQQVLQKEQQNRIKQQTRSGQQSTADSICYNCGARVERGMKFCEECGAQLGTGQCPHCHNTVDSQLALCPYCGKPVDTGKCSFCGATMENGEKFCPECGNSREGITCPECGTLNFRSFCRKCNAPLNEMASKTIEKIKNDPRLVRSRRLAEELAELEQKITLMVGQIDSEQGEGTTGDTSIGPDDSINLSDEDMAILERYKELFSAVVTPSEVVKEKPRSVSVQNTRKKVSVDRNLLKSAVEEFRAKASEMQSVLDSLLPDPNDPPEEQRNFFCACKLLTYSTCKETVRKNIGWVCNLCGCFHAQPSECARPELGGQWVCEEIEIIKKVTNNTTVYL